MTTYTEAVDQILATVNTAWQSSTTAVVGYVPDIYWQGVEEPKKPDLTKYWARVSQVGFNDEQSTLRNGDSEQRYTTNGNVYVQIFAPKKDSLGMTNGRELATIARNSFRGTTTDGCVWFKNARIVELDPEESFYRLNVIAEYEYDEIH